MTPTAPLARAVAAPAETDRRLGLTALCLGFFMVILDGTIVSVALPSIQRDLVLTTPDLAWVVNAYLVAFGGLLLLAGRLGDLIGRRRVFLGGVATFTAGSLLCGLSQGSGELVAARAVQGVGGALTSGVILGMLATMFPDAKERARAFSTYAFVGAAGASAGTVAGGILTDLLDWRWIFLVNVPVGIGTFVLARSSLTRDRGLGFADGLDAGGALLVAAAMATGLLAIVGTADHGFGSPRTVTIGVLAIALFGLFLVREAKARSPLVPLRFFRARNVIDANVIQLLMIAGFFGQQFIIALYLQRVLGYSPIDTGLAMLPIPIAIAATSIGLAARLIGRFGPRTVLAAGLTLATSSLAVLARVPDHGQYAVDVLGPFVVFGIGAALSMPALTTIAMTGAPDEDAGMVSGFFNTVQQVGSAVGLAVLAAVAAARSDHLAGVTSQAALAGGYRLAFLVAAALVLAALLVVLALRRTLQPAS